MPKGRGQCQKCISVRVSPGATRLADSSLYNVHVLLDHLVLDLLAGREGFTVHRDDVRLHARLLCPCEELRVRERVQRRLLQDLHAVCRRVLDNREADNLATHGDQLVRIWKSGLARGWGIGDEWVAGVLEYQERANITGVNELRG